MPDQNQLSEKRMIAVLIDGDNAQPAIIKEMLAEVGKYGRTTIRRIYGDWTTPNMTTWKEKLHENAIQPIQQFRNTIGKNATDSAMIIDAMDILLSDVVGGFCLVSSDSDYTRLATRIRESGSFVMGIGKQKTPKAFTHSCDVFVFEENLAPNFENGGTKPKASATTVAIVSVMKAWPLLRKALELCVREDGWADLSGVGSTLRKLDPSFDFRTFGCSNLKALFANFSDSIEMREEKTSGGNTAVFVRYK